MEKFEQAVWRQYDLRREAGAECPAVSHVSAVLSEFSTLFQRRGGTRDDVGLVFRLAEWKSDWIPAPATSVQLLQPTVATNIDGVSAAERLVLTLEKVPDVLGKLIYAFDHGNFTDKDHARWGSDTRQTLQPPHTQFVTQDDLDFVKFIERDGPLPAKDVGKFFQRKWAQLPNEHPEWKYKDADNLRRRYQRLKPSIERMGLSLRRNV